jgi:signal transduction histidine kinase
MFNSLRWKFTAWYAGASILAVLLVGLAIFFLESRAISHRLEGSIQSAGDAVRAATAANLRQSGMVDPLKAAEQAVETVASHGGLSSNDVFVMLLDENGAVRINPDSIDAAAVNDEDSFERALDRQVDWHTVEIDGTSLRVKTFPLLDDDGNLLGIVQAGKSMEDGNAALRTLLLTMAGGGLAALALLAVGGYFIAGKAIQPVQQSYERQRQFVANASHELRTPLAVIRTNAGLLLRNNQADPALEDIDTEAGYMGRLIDNLLLLAEGDRGQLHVETAPLDLTEIVRSAGQTAELLADRSELSFRSIVREPLMIISDADRVRQAILILLDNAFKYTPSGGTVTLTARREGLEAVVEVSDTGVGMSKEELARATDRFFTADKARSRSKGSAGLGLSIARELATALEGKLELESAAGGGTTARLRLPLMSPAEEAAPHFRLRRSGL